ncbi:hypothetical protein GOV04_02080 [Candidatus Woesearchaeota archaeon]|nr:hypothetical protein [Candidatus Woesearchaeota archaeon]
MLNDTIVCSIIISTIMFIGPVRWWQHYVNAGKGQKLFQHVFNFALWIGIFALLTYQVWLDYNNNAIVNDSLTHWLLIIVIPMLTSFIGNAFWYWIINYTKIGQDSVPRSRPINCQ